MKKRIIFSIIGLGVLLAILAGIKALQIGKMIDQGKKYSPPPETVTTAVAKYESWETALSAVGTLTAVQGVTVAAEISGRVARITFTPGGAIKKGDLLINQDTGSEDAQLPGAIADANLARTNLRRADELLADKIISQADHDKAVATSIQAKSQVDNIRAAIAKKTIRAPFNGRLGIRQVNLGQILREGDPIVTLQALDPIFVDFSLPQQQLQQVHPGLPVRLTTDALPGETIEGRITALNSQVDSDTRNIKVQATVANRGEKLRPGMFGNVSIGLPVQQKVLVIPVTAVFYAPYSDSVFVVDDRKDGKGQKGGKVLRQQFVRLGGKQGDFVAVTSGLKEGETIVSTGVFKLRNGQEAVIDNKLAPDFQKVPKPENN